jgi:hypothetical protein
MNDQPIITIKIIRADERSVTYGYCVAEECVRGIVQVGESIEIYPHEIKDV